MNYLSLILAVYFNLKNKFFSILYYLQQCAGDPDVSTNKRKLQATA